ncbi:hypothetical protein TIFTF001_031584 [Ficus carica]|uniref:F-box domain-containing protein n=1 Tax=Ficus carica TaxID=3494 RepID=A0AA88DVH5_FICCA|nr:hypothetical protein TIFTF001_031584 [Ficus carica]
MPSFGALPEDCLVLILSKISPGDLCRLSAVSTAFRSACKSNALWEPFISSLPHSLSTFVSSLDFYFCAIIRNATFSMSPRPTPSYLTRRLRQSLLL